MLNAVADASGVEFIGVLDAFIDHTKHHFTEEDVWMGAADFPPYHCHRGKHGNVLALCYEVRRRVAVGKTELGRRPVAKLPAWFAQHVDMVGRMMMTYLV